MGIKRDDLYALHKKAEQKKDGIFSYKSMPYIVVNKTLTHVGLYSTIYSVHGHFTSTAWQGESYKMRKMMKEIYKGTKQ